MKRCGEQSSGCAMYCRPVHHSRKCSLFFNHILYHGNRVSKSSSSDLNAFSSPNFPPLVNVGTDMVVNWNEVLRQPSPRKFHAHKQMCTNVATLRLFPGVTTLVVRAFLAPPIQGMVLETFKSGNAPNWEDLLDVLQEACSRGVVIVAISQCAKGTVSDAYETGRALLQTGVVPGSDMTPESDSRADMNYERHFEGNLVHLRLCSKAKRLNLWTSKVSKACSPRSSMFRCPGLAIQRSS